MLLLHDERSMKILRLTFKIHIIKGMFCQIKEHLPENFVMKERVNIYGGGWGVFTFLLSKFTGFNVAYKKNI
jgi:hypothetical protein